MRHCGISECLYRIVLPLLFELYIYIVHLSSLVIQSTLTTSVVKLLVPHPSLPPLTLKQANVGASSRSLRTSESTPYKRQPKCYGRDATTFTARAMTRNRRCSAACAPSSPAYAVRAGRQLLSACAGQNDVVPMSFPFYGDV